jgi:hypothetical protein
MVNYRTLALIISKNQLTEKKFDRTQHLSDKCQTVFSITKLLDTLNTVKKKNYLLQFYLISSTSLFSYKYYLHNQHKEDNYP